MITDYTGLRDLDLPQVTEAAPWGHPCLKAHGKMWC